MARLYFDANAARGRRDIDLELLLSIKCRPANSGPVALVLAGSVHLLTASGALWALLAMRAATAGDFRASLGWMGLAVAIDALDGPLARGLRVAERVPGIDGALLDNIVDYASYVLAPTWLMLEAGWFPDGYGLIAAAAICLSSAFQFSHREAKSSDHHFRGFPCYWNVLAFYLLVLRPHPWWAFAIVIALCVLVFAPLRCVYPSRTTTLRGTTLLLSLAWCATVVAIVWSYPKTSMLLVQVSLAYPVYYATLSLYLSLRRSDHSSSR